MAKVPARVLDAPVPILGFADLALALLQHPPGARVHEDHPGAAEVAAEAPTGAGAGRVRLFRELAQLRGGVDVGADAPVELVFVERPRREVAEVLVDPVAHHPGSGAALPQEFAPHLPQPGTGDVPVVAHVVVVPLHRDRDRRHQPADQRVPPGLFVQPRVLLVVGDLVSGRGLGAAPFADLFAGAGRALVDVDLVAEQEQELGPLVVLAADHFARQHVQGVVLLAVLVAVFAVHVGLLVRQGDPAGSEADVERGVTAEGADPGPRAAGAGVPPAPRAAGAGLVLGGGARLQAVD